MTTTPEIVPFEDQTPDMLRAARLAGAKWKEMSGPPNDRETIEKWLESLGSTFVTVWMYLPKGTTLTSRPNWVDERHIADPETIETTVSMSLERLGGNYAIWQQGDQWALYRRRPELVRHLPSREAAEMLAIHGA